MENYERFDLGIAFNKFLLLHYATYIIEIRNLFKMEGHTLNVEGGMIKEMGFTMHCLIGKFPCISIKSEVKTIICLKLQQWRNSIGQKDSRVLIYLIELQKSLHGSEDRV